MKNSKIYIFMLCLLLLPNIVFASGNIKEEYQLNLYKAKVIKIENEKKINDSVIQKIRIKILNKDYKNKETVITKTYIDNGYDKLLKKGNRIIIHKEVNDDEASFYFNNIDKTYSLLMLVLIFILFVILLGGFKGIKALIALIIAIFLILFFLVPLLLKGYSPIILSIITCIVSSILTFIITSGFSKKTLTAILGVSFGLLVGGIFAYAFGIITKTTGFSSENAQMLQYLPGGIKFDFKGLLFAGIIIGSLGACMDVSISIASSLEEIKSHNKKITDKELIKSGFNIGKDIMGTMVNTLVLAYTGSSLATLLIFNGLNKSFTEIINLDSIATEIIRALSGSIGLLFAIPFTIFTFVLLNKERKHKHEKKIKYLLLLLVIVPLNVKACPHIDSKGVKHFEFYNEDYTVMTMMYPRDSYLYSRDIVWSPDNTMLTLEDEKNIVSEGFGFPIVQNFETYKSNYYFTDESLSKGNKKEDDYKTTIDGIDNMTVNGDYVDLNVSFKNTINDSRKYVKKDTEQLYYTINVKREDVSKVSDKINNTKVLNDSVYKVSSLYTITNSGYKSTEVKINEFLDDVIIKINNTIDSDLVAVNLNYYIEPIDVIYDNGLTFKVNKPGNYVLINKDDIDNISNSNEIETYDNEVEKNSNNIIIISAVLGLALVVGVVILLLKKKKND